MTAKELRAITAQGPAVVMVAREDMLRLLDGLEDAKNRLFWNRVAFWTLTTTLLSLFAFSAFAPSTILVDWILG
jgi:hypothetical protein